MSFISRFLLSRSLFTSPYHHGITSINGTYVSCHLLGILSFMKSKEDVKCFRRLYIHFGMPEVKKNLLMVLVGQKKVFLGITHCQATNKIVWIKANIKDCFNHLQQIWNLNFTITWFIFYNWNISRNFSLIVIWHFFNFFSNN